MRGPAWIMCGILLVAVVFGLVIQGFSGGWSAVWP